MPGNVRAWPLLRGALLASVPLNLGGFVTFLPPVLVFRQRLGLPEADAFYLWVIAMWVLAFAGAYLYAGLSGRLDPSLLALGATGKIAFAGLLLARVWRGLSPPSAAAAAMPDLLLAAVFVIALWRRQGEGDAPA